MPTIHKLDLPDLAPFLTWRATDLYLYQILEREIELHYHGVRVIFVAKIDEDIIGTIQFVTEHRDRDLADGKSIGYLQALEVDDRYRRQGIATALIKTVVAEALSRNFQRLTISVEPDNLPALALYQKLGFVEFKRSVDCWQDREFPVICLAKNMGVAESRYKNLE